MPTAECLAIEQRHETQALQFRQLRFDVFGMPLRSHRRPVKRHVAIRIDQNCGPLYARAGIPRDRAPIRQHHLLVRVG